MMRWGGLCAAALQLCGCAVAPVVGPGGDGISTQGGIRPAPSLLACGSFGNSQDAVQVANLFAFAKSVCVTQLGEESDLPHDSNLPATCHTPACAHVIGLIDASCATLFRSTGKQQAVLAAAFGPLVASAAARCQPTAAVEDQRRLFPITSWGPHVMGRPLVGRLQAPLTLGGPSVRILLMIRSTTSYPASCPTDSISHGGCRWFCLSG
jgi:hypothetical protein